LGKKRPRRKTNTALRLVTPLASLAQGRFAKAQRTQRATEKSVGYWYKQAAHQPPLLKNEEGTFTLFFVVAFIFLPKTLFSVYLHILRAFVLFAPLSDRASLAREAKGYGRLFLCSLFSSLPLPIADVPISGYIWVL